MVLQSGYRPISTLSVMMRNGSAQVPLKRSSSVRRSW